jgi:hypothetical protein
MEETPIDYEMNENVEDLSRPLSHAALVKLYLLNQWPTMKSDHPGSTDDSVAP